jgi:hypothetical protein
MRDERQEQLRAAAAARAGRHRRRVSMIRRRVIAATLATFVGAWAWLAVQMASGNDPVLGDRATPAAKSPSQPTQARARLVATPQGLVLVRPSQPQQQPATAPAAPPATTRTS